MVVLQGSNFDHQSSTCPKWPVWVTRGVGCNGGVVRATVLLLNLPSQRGSLVRVVLVLGLTRLIRRKLQCALARLHVPVDEHAVRTPSAPESPYHA